MQNFQTRRKNPFKGLIALLIILFFVSLLGIGYWNNLQSPLKEDDAVRAFVINKGEAVSSIAERLEKEDFIKSALAFKINYKFFKKTPIEAGDFKLSASMSLAEIFESLSKGSIDKWVTLLEGWRVEEYAEALNKEIGVDKAEFIKLAKKEEGMLFPDTYLFNPEASTSDIISIMKNTFEAKFNTPEISGKIENKGLTPKQGLILASIVEREGRSQEVRTKIASILLRRYKINMGLNADATVQYILGYQPDEKSWWKKRLLYEDLKVESPYNTYIHVGFPPAPIANPSFSSMKAVADADPSTPYLYYFHDSEGNSYYAETLEEHNENVANHR